MAWPLASDFSTVLQNPSFAFSDKALKTADIEKDENRQPRARSGNFANVYKAQFPNGKEPIAVRVFTSASPERRDRYQAIGTYLTGRRLDCLVDFTYRDDGIRSMDGKRYPLVTMDWVQGEQLFEWVRKKCKSRDTKSLVRVSDLWLATIKQLSDAKIAHGDLQHANVLVTDTGKLKLVDYDCMCVPALVGRKNLEIGVDPYQHPERDQNTQLSLSLDNFSALFIYAALKSLAANPDLWVSYVDKPKYDKLLFRREDLREPTQSRLIQELKRSKDSEVQRLTKELVDLTHASIDSVPRLDQVLFSFSSVESLLSQRDFDAAIDLLTRHSKQVTDAPATLQSRIRNAQERVQSRLALETAVNAGDEEAMQRLYLPKLQDDYPRAQPLVAVARLAPQVIPVLQRLRMKSQARDWRGFVSEWISNKPALAQRKSAEQFAALARTWEARNKAWDHVLVVLKKPVGDDTALATAWDQLAKVGGHPESDTFRARIDEQIERERAWSAFCAIPRAIGMTTDANLVRTWNEEVFLNWAQAERERPRVDAARLRLAAVQQIKQLASQSLDYRNEEAIIRSASQLPNGYQHDQSDRVVLSRQRITVLNKLQPAFRDPISDLNLVDLDRQLDRLQCRVFLTSAQKQRISLAQKRAVVLERLKQIPTTYPIQQAPKLDADLLNAWQVDLLSDCCDSQPWLPVYDKAKRRKVVLAELKAAIATTDRMRIAEAFLEPCLKGYPLAAESQRIAQRAVAEVKSIRQLVDTLKQSNSSKFLSTFDASTIRQNSEFFEPYREKLIELLRQEVLPIGKIGLGPPIARQGVVREPKNDGSYRICWNWPEPRFCDRCLVVICPQLPGSDEEPCQISTHVQIPIDRKSYEEGGGSRLIHVDADWLESYVVVWGAVDLGFGKFYSEPFVLGKLEAQPGISSGQSRRRLFG